MVCQTDFLLLLSITLIGYSSQQHTQQQAIRGTQCAPNQVVTKLTFYEDGAIEAECNKLPCGVTGTGPKCVENQTSCREESGVLSGMKWASNGQSVLLRCCHLTVPTRVVYVGTDRVTLGSYYSGGLVDEKDLYGKNGDIEFDYISNMRIEQGGVRIWVYRVMCSKFSSQAPIEEHGQIKDGRAYAFEKRRQYLLKQLEGQSKGTKVINAENVDDYPQRLNPTSPKPFNPLRYTPPDYQRSRKATNRVDPVDRLL